MISKYYKPKSVAWWASAALIVAGLVKALALVIPALIPVALVIDALSGGVQPAILINAGLIGVGLRGAIGNT